MKILKSFIVLLLLIAIVSCDDKKEKQPIPTQTKAKEKLIKKVKKSWDSLNKNNVEAIKKSNYFRDYALTNKLEFVAVIMEHFFETPEDLQNKFPVLFRKIEIMLNYKSTKL